MYDSLHYLHLSMNYKWLLAVLGIILSLLTYSQSISSVAIDFNKMNENDELIAAPNIKFDVKNHSWSLGPTILISYGDQIEEREALKLTGFQIGYEHFIHGKTSKWNLFHSFDFFAQRIKDTQNSQFFDLASNSFKLNKIDQIENSLLLTGNVGVLWNICDKMAATSMMGIGINTIFRNTQSDLDEFEDVFIEQVWMLKLGVRYYLNLVK